MPHEDLRDGDTYTPESDSEAAGEGPDGNWKFWDDQIKAGLVHERRWRHEALECERLYFGDDDDPGLGGAEDTRKSNVISDKTAPISTCSSPFCSVRRRNPWCAAAAGAMARWMKPT